MKKVLLLILSFATIAYAGEWYTDFFEDNHIQHEDDYDYDYFSEKIDWSLHNKSPERLVFENARIEPVEPIQGLPNYPNYPLLTNDGPASLDFEIYDYGIIENNSTREVGPKEIGSVLDTPFGAFENTDSGVLPIWQDANQGKELCAGVNEDNYYDCFPEDIDWSLHNKSPERLVFENARIEPVEPIQGLPNYPNYPLLTNDGPASLDFEIYDYGIIENNSTREVGPEEIGSVLDTPFGAFENTDSGVLPISQDANQGEELCAGVNEYSRQLSKPLIDKQKNKKIFECIECGKIFPRSSNLIAHIHRHRGEKPHKCDKCGKAFVTSGDLDRHIKIHAEVKFYQCDTCLMEFADPSSCRRHMRLIHNADPSSCRRHMRLINKPEVEVQIMPDIAIGLNKTFDQQVDKTFKCSECSYTTIDYRNFVRHKRRHTGEKPFKCNQCARPFTDSTSCKRHMKLVHNLEYEKPQKCLSHEVFEQEEESEKEDSDYSEEE